MDCNKNCLLNVARQYYNAHHTRKVHKGALWQKCGGQKHMLHCKLQSKVPGPQSKDWIASAALNIADLHNMHIM